MPGGLEGHSGCREVTGSRIARSLDWERRTGDVWMVVCLDLRTLLLFLHLLGSPAGVSPSVFLCWYFTG